MKILTKYIIKEHIGPFFFALAVIMFILLMNFLVKYIDQIFGKGLPIITIVKLILFNMGWMLALAVPMASLVAVLMAYGRFSADNEITILKSSGISVLKIILPSLYLGILLTAVMIYFSDQILPETNHKASMLFRSIRQKKPTLHLEEHIFYNLDKYTFVVGRIEKTLPEQWLDLSNLLGPEYDNLDQLDRLHDLTIFDRSSVGKDITIIAKEGYMVYSRKYKALIFTLFDGEYHEMDTKKMEEYQRSLFRKNVVYIPAKEFDFEEKESSYRSDREMNIKMMKERIREFSQQIQRQKTKIAKNIASYFQKTERILALNDSLAKKNIQLPVISDEQWRNAARRALTTAKRREQQMKTSKSYIENHYQSVNKYAVEIYKKISIPFASIVFVLVGAPLGIMARKGSMGVAISMSIGFFLLYWAFLIGGEDLADRRIVSPMMAMWAANIVVGAFGVLLMWRAVRENATIKWERLVFLFKLDRLFKKEKS